MLCTLNSADVKVYMKNLAFKNVVFWLRSLEFSIVVVSTLKISCHSTETIPVREAGISRERLQYQLSPLCGAAYF